MTYVANLLDKFDVDPLGSINSINIEETKDTAERFREEIGRKLEERINSHPSNKVVVAKFAEISCLLDRATTTDDLSEKSRKFHEASRLVLEIADKGYGDYPAEVYEVVKNYALLILGSEKFARAFHASKLAKEAGVKKDLSQQYLKCTDVFEALTDIVTRCWNLYPKNIRRTLDSFVRKMLTLEAFEHVINQKSLRFELSLRLKMLGPSVKNCKDLVGNYRKARKNFIYSFLRAVKLDTLLYRSQISSSQSKKDLLSPFLESIGVKTNKQVQNNQYTEINEPPYKVVEIDEQLNDEFEYEYNEADLVLRKNALADAINRAIRETTELMEAGFDITDPSIVTPLGWMANKYPEIAEQCNQTIKKIADWQRQNLKWQNTEITSLDEW